MEFKKIKISDLIPASYNPRKKLKPGDREYENIKNSIIEFDMSTRLLLTEFDGYRRTSENNSVERTGL